MRAPVSPRRLLAVAALAALAAAPGLLAAQATYRWVDEKGQVHFSDQPPPPEAKQVERKRFSASRPDPVPAYAVSRAAEEFPVTLYTASDCTEPCSNARSLLEKRGIPFVEVAVATEEDLARFRQVFGPPDEVPAATVGRQQLRGFEAGAWNKLLDQAGYPREPLPTR